MKKILLALMVALPALAGVSTGSVYKLNNAMGKAAREANLGTIVAEGGDRGSTENGHMPQQMLVGEYDVASLGGHSLAVIELGVSLPDNAIITRSFVDVLTSFTGTGATVSIGSEASTDILNAVAVTGLVADTRVEGVSTGTAATMKKMTAERGIRVDVNTSAVTAGKLKVYLEYVMGE